jgi:hypothetical protein
VTPDATHIIAQQVKGDGGFIAGGDDPMNVAGRRDQLVERAGFKVIFGNQPQIGVRIIRTDRRGRFVDLLGLLARIKTHKPPSQVIVDRRGCTGGQHHGTQG